MGEWAGRKENINKYVAAVNNFDGAPKPLNRLTTSTQTINDREKKW